MVRHVRMRGCIRTSSEGSMVKTVCRKFLHLLPPILRILAECFRTQNLTSCGDTTWVGGRVHSALWALLSLSGTA